MLQRKLLFLFVLPLLALPGCFDGPWTDIRDVEYRPQLSSNYCGLACVQMWALYDDKPEPTQDTIYYQIVANNSHGGYIWAEDIRNAVGFYTDSSGYLQEEPSGNVYQDACIASCIAAIKDFRLAIMPFYNGNHAVLATGYKWHYENGKRVADVMYYHDPDNKPYRQLPAADIKNTYFTWDNQRGSYWVIVGRRRQTVDGWDGYLNFLEEGGTYYGGPPIYNPEEI